MGRDFQINGETLINVKGPQLTLIQNTIALGLASDEVRVIPRWIHSDIHVNDFGPDIPPDVQFQLAEVTIRMVLIHFDLNVLNTCIGLAMAQGGGIGLNGAVVDGVCAGAGQPMGGGWPLYNSSCNLISLGLTSPQLSQPWTFLASYISTPPVEWPLGVKAMMVPLTFRAIPYVAGTASSNGPLTLPAEITSKGVSIWNHNLLT